MKLHEIIMEGPFDFLFGKQQKGFAVSLPVSIRGKDVRDMQQALEALGYNVGPPGLDGIIGPYTTGAIKKYQVDNNIETTGKPTGQMIDLLNKQLASKPELLAKLVPTSDSTVSPNAKSVKNKVNPNDVSKYLSSKGLDRNHILGILANIDRESNFNSGAYNPNDVNGPSGGFFQHHDKTSDPRSRRFTQMVNSAGENWQSNWQGQLDFALSEPAGRRYVALSFKSPEDATEWWVRNFEIPGNIEQEVALRQSNLSKYA